MASFLYNLLHIPLTNLLIILLLALATFALLKLWFKRRQSEAPLSPADVPAKPANKLGRATVYVARLVGFALFTFVLVGGGLLLYLDYQAVSEEIALAPSAVEAPAEMPFAIEEIRFTGGDETELAGWFVPPENGAAIILLHGYSGNRLGVLHYAEMLVKAGYGVLMYDERGSGESGGSFRAHGWIDTPDVGGAITYLKSRPEVDAQRLGIAGCSIGGQIALQGTVAYPELKAVWADGFSVILASDNAPPVTWADSLAYLSNAIIDWMYTWRLGMPRPAGMIQIIGRIAPRPVMLVGGGNALGYFGSEARRMHHYAAYAGPNARVWIIPEATHCDGPLQRPEEYEQRLVEFFNQAFLEP